MAIPITVDIPEKALPDLRKVVELDEHLFNALLKAISESGPTLTRAKFHNKIASRTQGMDDEAIGAILRTTFSFHATMSKLKTPLTALEFSEKIANSPMIEKHIELDQEFRSVLASRLNRLLSPNKAISVTAKAFDVMTEHSHIYCRARILSDIRPVFAEGPEIADAAVIIHNLQISYHKGDVHHEFYVALDTDDIKQLKTVVERAEKKTVALEQMIERAKVPYLER